MKTKIEGQRLRDQEPMSTSQTAHPACKLRITFTNGNHASTTNPKSRKFGEISDLFQAYQFRHENLTLLRDLYLPLFLRVANFCELERG